MSYYNDPKNTNPQAIIVYTGLFLIITGTILGLFDVSSFGTIFGSIVAYFAIGLICTFVVIQLKPEWETKKQCITGYLIGLFIFVNILWMVFNSF